MPNIVIPKEFVAKRKLIAIPEAEYRRYRQMIQARDQEVADLRQSEGEVKAGKVIYAASATEALKEADARGWLD